MCWFQVKINFCLFQNVIGLLPSDWLISMEEGALSRLTIVLWCWLVGYQIAVGSQVSHSDCEPTMLVGPRCRFHPWHHGYSIHALIVPVLRQRLTQAGCHMTTSFMVNAPLWALTSYIETFCAHHHGSITCLFLRTSCPQSDSLSLFPSLIQQSHGLPLLIISCIALPWAMSPSI